MVPRPTPSALAISATVTSWALYRARASLVCSGESLAGRPPARRSAPARTRLPLELGQRGEDIED
jgi:hypothetical protein